MKKFFLYGFLFIAYSLPVIYLLAVYSSLPAIVPTHFGIDGKANGFSQKQDLIWIILLMTLVSAGVFLLIRFLPKIDPKKSAALASGQLKKIALAVTGLIAVAALSIIQSAKHGSLTQQQFLYPGIGLFFIIVGNVMVNIKPNYFVGIRVPWTLENEDNWRATHRMGGKLWVIGGALIVLLTLLLPVRAASSVFVSGVILMAFVPIIYSFIYFKKHQADENQLRSN